MLSARTWTHVCRNTFSVCRSIVVHAQKPCMLLYCAWAFSLCLHVHHSAVRPVQAPAHAAPECLRCGAPTHRRGRRAAPRRRAECGAPGGIGAAGRRGGRCARRLAGAAGPRIRGAPTQWPNSDPRLLAYSQDIAGRLANATFMARQLNSWGRQPALNRDVHCRVWHRVLRSPHGAGQ